MKTWHDKGITTKLPTDSYGLRLSNLFVLPLTLSDLPVVGKIMCRQLGWQHSLLHFSPFLPSGLRSRAYYAATFGTKPIF